MKVLIDTCVVIDYVQKRGDFAEAARKIFKAAGARKFIGCITAKAATDISFLTHKFFHDKGLTKATLAQLFQIMRVLDTTAGDVFHAAQLESSADFEDAIMIETAVRSGMDCIVTRNNKDYSKSPVPVYTPEQFIDFIAQEAHQE